MPRPFQHPREDARPDGFPADVGRRDQPAVRFQHAAGFRQDIRRMLDDVKQVRDDDRIEGSVAKGQIVGVVDGERHVAGAAEFRVVAGDGDHFPRRVDGLQARDGVADPQRDLSRSGSDVEDIVTGSEFLQDAADHFVVHRGQPLRLPVIALRCAVPEYRVPVRCHSFRHRTLPHCVIRYAPPV